MKIVEAKKGKRVLIVEDDRNLNRLVSYNLSRNGFLTQSVLDGNAAKEKLCTHIFDVVVLDIMLPGIDGFSICKWIKDSLKDPKPVVVILTARAEPLDKIYGSNVGADYYLTKPFSASNLMDIIRKITALEYREFTM